MKNLATIAAAVALLALAMPASAAEKGAGHCAQTAQGNCIDKDPPAGWNIGQPYACEVDEIGSNTFWYSYWTNGEYWWVENIPALGAALLAGCDTDTLRDQFVFVTNTISGAFDRVQNRPPGH